MPPKKKIAPSIPLETKYVEREALRLALIERMGHSANLSGTQSGYRASFGYARVEIPHNFSGTFTGRTEGLGDKSTTTTYSVALDGDWFQHLLTKVVEILSTGRTIECGPGIGMRSWRYETPQSGVDSSWEILAEMVEGSSREPAWNLNPDYQRGAVWSQEQQERFIGHVLEGGQTPLIFVQRFRDEKHLPKDASSWMETPSEVVDGQQRLRAIHAFMRGKIGARVFYNNMWHVHYFREMNEFEQSRMTLSSKVVFVDLSRVDRLNLYLRLNGGGTPHTEAELNRVRGLLAQDTNPDLR